MQRNEFWASKSWLGNIFLSVSLCRFFMVLRLGRKLNGGKPFWSLIFSWDCHGKASSVLECGRAAVERKRAGRLFHKQQPSWPTEAFTYATGYCLKASNSLSQPHIPQTRSRRTSFHVVQIGWFSAALIQMYLFLLILTLCRTTAV